MHHNHASSSAMLHFAYIPVSHPQLRPRDDDEQGIARDQQLLRRLQSMPLEKLCDAAAERQKDAIDLRFCLEDYLNGTSLMPITEDPKDMFSRIRGLAVDRLSHQQYVFDTLTEEEKQINYEHIAALATLGLRMVEKDEERQIILPPAQPQDETSAQDDTTNAGVPNDSQPAQATDMSYAEAGKAEAAQKTQVKSELSLEEQYIARHGMSKSTLCFVFGAS